MKKLFLFVMIILPSTLLSQTVSGLKVETVAGSASTVTFDVEWEAASLTTPWLDSMWVFVDYNKNGRMTRLLISGGTLTEHTATKAGTGEFIYENDMGAWVYGDARSAGSFSAKVQLFTKEMDIVIAGACAYASSYPPVGKYVSETEIVFTGTPMYEITLTDGIIVETIESGGTFLLPCSYTVSSFTDATGAPGIISCPEPTGLMLMASPETICAGESSTLTASATGAVAYSLNGTNWQPETDFNETPLSTTTYTLYAKTEAGCSISVTDAAVVTVNPTPTISLSSGDASQSVNPGTAITDIVYTVSDAATISMTGSLPAGVTVDDSGSSFTIGGTPTEGGMFGYSLTAAVGGCTGTASAGTLMVAVIQLQGSCTYTEPAVVGTFANFHTTSAYTATTYTSLIDERDGKVYPVVKIGGRWIMARNLNYQKDLAWQTYSYQPSISQGHDPYLIGSFWCPGGDGGAALYYSTRESCDVWGALYSWETAMSFNGLGDWTESPSTYNVGGAANLDAAKANHGRTASGSGRGGRGICPPNWHVPTDNEWGIISDGMESNGGTIHQDASSIGEYGIDAGKRGKSTCMCSSGSCNDDTNVSWTYSSIEDIQDTDVYGFRVLPTGYRYHSGSNFYNRGSYAYFWSSSVYGSGTDAWDWQFHYNNATVSRYYDRRSCGFSIRCIRDL